MDSSNRKHSLLTPRKHLVLSMVLILSGLAWVYAAPFMNISNVANIETGATLVATGEVPSNSVCDSNSGLYTDSPSLSWGNVPTGTKQVKYICMQNTGTGEYTVAATNTLPTASGSIVIPELGNKVAPGAYLFVEIDWFVSPQAPLGGLTFTITFQ